MKGPIIFLYVTLTTGSTIHNVRAHMLEHTLLGLIFTKLNHHVKKNRETIA